MTPLDALIDINTQDFVNAWGGHRLGPAQGLLRRISRPAAEAFAKQLLTYDAEVGKGGLPLGGVYLVKEYAAGLRVAGRQHIPPEGPLLVLSNHPGLADTVSLFTAINRTDLNVLALERAFLRALPNTAERLFMLPDDVLRRRTMLREVGKFMENGGAILTFPAGEIEPDPLVLPGAVESLETWARSVGLFAKMAPQLRIVTAIVSGVLNPDAQRSPLIQIQRNRKKREFLGATLQILWKRYRTNIVHVAFSPPMLAADFANVNYDAGAVTAAVVEAARALIDRPPGEWETVL
jgi:hypothetical protein